MTTASKKWQTVRTRTNEGKPFDIFVRGDYTVCLNVNKGRPGHCPVGKVDGNGHEWWYEVTVKVNGHGDEAYVGEMPTCRGAKALATQHEQNQQRRAA